MANTPATPSPASQPSSTPQAAPATPKPGVVDQKAAPVVKPVEKAAPVQSDDLWDVTVDGKTEKKSRKEILEAYQLRQLSDKKRSEAEKAMSEYTKLFKVLQNDPIKFMQATGIDFDKLSTSYLAKKAEESMQDPKDRELQKARAEAEQYKKWVSEQKEKQANEVKAQEVEVQRKQIHQEIISAIEAHKDLGMPVDEELIIAIAQKLKLQDKKQKPLDAKDGVIKAYESSQKYLKGLAAKMDGEALVKWLGDDIAKKIRKHDLSVLKAKRGLATQPQTNTTSSVKPVAQNEAPKKPYKTWSDFKRETLDKIQ